MNPLTGNGNGNGNNISARSVLTAVLGLLQALLIAAGYMLYDQLQDTNANVNKIKDGVTAIQLEMIRESSDLKTRLGVLESKNKQP